MATILSKHSAILFLLIFFLVAGCRHRSSQNKDQNKHGTAKKASNRSSIAKAQYDTTIVNHDFSYGPLRMDIFKADTNKIKSLFTDQVILKLEKHKNEEGGSFDLYNFTDGVNKIILYNNDGFYIEDADIKNANVLLNKKLTIGMKRDAFLDLLKVKNIKCETIIVVDEEYTFESVYIFKDAKLQNIEMGQIVE